MTSYIPLLPTISVRRGPCQDRFRIGPRAKLPARRTSAPNPATVNSYDAPGAAVSPAPAANRAGRATRRAASSRRTSSRRSCPKPASRPRPSPQPTSRTKAQHTRAPVRRNLHLAASLWTTTRRSPTRSSRPLSSASGQPRPPGRAQARPEQRSPMRGGTLACRRSGGIDVGCPLGGPRIAVEGQCEQRFLRDTPKHGAVAIDVQSAPATVPDRVHQGEDDIVGLLHFGRLPREGLPPRGPRP
jgi:hypothetical protein